MKTQSTKLIVLLFSLLFSISCVEIGREKSISTNSINEILGKYDFNLDKINKKGREGIKIMNIKELETFLQFLRKKEFDENILTEIFRNNLIDPSKFHFKSFFRAKSVEKYSLENKAIQCLQNWRNVYGRFGINNSLSQIDVSFQVGTGSGRIESWDFFLRRLDIWGFFGKEQFYE